MRTVTARIPDGSPAAPAANPSTAASIIPVPPEAWTVTHLAPADPSCLAAAATVFGMSWSLASTKIGRPSARISEINAGPGPMSSSSPILKPATWGARPVASRSASGPVGVSSATSIGG